jgi:two-component sensor histidine kinase
MKKKDHRSDTSEKIAKGIQKSEFIINILDSLSHPFYVIDANDYTIKLANSVALSSNVTGTDTCYSLTHGRKKPCEDDINPCVMKKIKETRKPVITEHTHLDQNGKPRVYEVHGYPIFDNKGNVTQVVEYNLDITERKKVEENLKASLREKDIFLREVHHRIKNNMAVISSLLNLQSRYIKDEQYKEIFKESVARLKTMSLIHDKLYRSEDLSKVVFSEYISDMVDKMYRSYDLSSRKITLTKEIEKITTLRIDDAIPCGLIINELVSNSLKHAFPEGQAGEIKVTLRSNKEGDVEMTVSDNGIGMPKDLELENSESMGLTLINALTRQLQSKIELNREKGTEYKISFRKR